MANGFPPGYQPPPPPGEGFGGAQQPGPVQGGPQQPQAQPPQAPQPPPQSQPPGHPPQPSYPQQPQQPGQPTYPPQTAQPPPMPPQPPPAGPGAPPAGYQQYPYAPLPPPKKGGAAKGCLIAGIIVAVVGVLVVVLLVTVVGIGVRKVVKEVDKAVTHKVIDVPVGQAGQSGPLSIKVVGWAPSAGDATSPPAPGNQYIVVDLEVRNSTGTESRPISALIQMSIEAAGGQAYTPSLMYNPDPKFPDGNILPGQTARGNVAFEVPANIGSMTFVYDPLLYGDFIRVKLQ